MVHVDVREPQDLPCLPMPPRVDIFPASDNSTVRTRRAGTSKPRPSSTLSEVWRHAARLPASASGSPSPPLLSPRAPSPSVAAIAGRARVCRVEIEGSMPRDIHCGFRPRPVRARPWRIAHPRSAERAPAFNVDALWAEAQAAEARGSSPRGSELGATYEGCARAEAAAPGPRLPLPPAATDAIAAAPSPTPRARSASRTAPASTRRDSPARLSASAVPAAAPRHEAPPALARALHIWYAAARSARNRQAISARCKLALSRRRAALVRSCRRILWALAAHASAARDWRATHAPGQPASAASALRGAFGSADALAALRASRVARAGGPDGGGGASERGRVPRCDPPAPLDAFVAAWAARIELSHGAGAASPAPGVPAGGERRPALWPAPLAPGVVVAHADEGWARRAVAAAVAAAPVGR